MHLIESYALTAGCLIDRCFIEEDPIELPQNKYITFHPFSPKGAIRQYNYWSVVIDLLKSNPKFTYEIVQIGGNNDPKYSNVVTDYLGKTTYHSLAYLIKHAGLHLGFDSFPTHLASVYDKKIVSIYAHNAINTMPYFSSAHNISLIQPDFSQHKPYYSDGHDPFGAINTIDPFVIYEKIIHLLEI
jgi:ADP-heptose:LPS heptosyltransferase